MNMQPDGVILPPFSPLRHLELLVGPLVGTVNSNLASLSTQPGPNSETDPSSGPVAQPYRIAVGLYLFLFASWPSCSKIDLAWYAGAVPTLSDDSLA
jgi:hypothetical protein